MQTATSHNRHHGQTPGFVFDFNLLWGLLLPGAILPSGLVSSGLAPVAVASVVGLVIGVPLASALARLDDAGSSAGVFRQVLGRWLAVGSVAACAAPAVVGWFPTVLGPGVVVGVIALGLGYYWPRLLWGIALLCCLTPSAVGAYLLATTGATTLLVPSIASAPVLQAGVVGLLATGVWLAPVGKPLVAKGPYAYHSGMGSLGLGVMAAVGFALIYAYWWETGTHAVGVVPAATLVVLVPLGAAVCSALPPGRSLVGYGLVGFCLVGLFSLDGGSPAAGWWSLGLPLGVTVLAWLSAQSLRGWERWLALGTFGVGLVGTVALFAGFDSSYQALVLSGLAVGVGWHGAGAARGLW